MTQVLEDFHRLDSEDLLPLERYTASLILDADVFLFTVVTIMVQLHD
jgi:hypothetical protein